MGTSTWTLKDYSKNNMCLKILFLFVLTALLNNVRCGNILYISPLPSPSHHIWNKILSMDLISKGHNVTMLSPNKEKEPTLNFTVHTLEGLYEMVRERFKMEDFVGKSTFKTIIDWQSFDGFMCDHDLKTKGVETLLNYPKDYKFDLVIYDMTSGQCLYPLIERFGNPPVIGVTAFLLPPLLSHIFGNHLYTSYQPFYNTEFTNKMNTAERVLNFIYTYTEMLIRQYFTTSTEFTLAKKRFGNHIRPFQEVERNMSLLLANTDPILNYPIALPPNIIPVGGLHIKPARNLPQDLKKIMDNAKHGVIFFSLGSNLRSADLKLEQKQAFLNAFAKLPQIVIWKFEADDLEELPKNVIIRKWLPQNDIFGHPNIKLFISHGGALSTQEAIYHGVPVLGIPFFSDQNVNIRRMEEKGIAEHLDISQKLTSDDLYKKIRQFLDTDKYKNNVRALSKLYRDQPQTPMERAIFWIEYVLRHGNAEHLVLPARDMPAYKTSNLDVLIVLILILVLIYSFLMLMLTVCKYLFLCSRQYSTKPKPTK